MSNNTTIADTILRHLGGNMFIRMVGAKNLVGSDEQRMLQFRVQAHAKDGINSVRIVLDASDTYTMTFYAIRGTKFTIKATMSGIYDDMLTSVFTDKTGLYTHL